MSRRRVNKKREIQPDVRCGDVVVAKFINCMMYDGKKATAENITYKALDIASGKLGVDPLEVFFKGLENVKPIVELKSRRVGGSTYQIPIEVRPERQLSLAIKWFIRCARSRKGEKTMSDRLAGEFMDAINNKGGAVKKKEDTHRMAEANRVFVHYRW
ncbi:30S ribosomal protein S7 [Rickettsiales endosymbiont of Peranema trichophorum]|uniref:30S ribosomal protein S7 n=1 Tax=Rickettsiales endosymbiont of Peranema trichophorum TaxID=2486577 RepID=UPI001022F7EE|nr:30S ribosomal protein S7 [Rickettsiales endosymbiont of Peranema trichophorum]RZI45556.1 30S ribosomal protein S7 [Rickettsiales endosymbiont of Peranema trichophorum]